MRVYLSGNVETTVLHFLHRCAPGSASARLIARKVGLPTPQVEAVLRRLRTRSMAVSAGKPKSLQEPRHGGLGWSSGPPHPPEHPKPKGPGQPPLRPYVKRPSLTHLQFRILRFMHWSARYLLFDELGGLAMYVGQPPAEVEAALTAMVEGRHLRHSRRELRWRIR